MTRSITSLIVLLAVIFALSGCANNDQRQKQPNPDQNKQAQTSTSTTPTSTQATTTPKEDLPVWPEKQFAEEDYEGWKTYTHEELGFKIKYPSNWKIKVREYYHDVKSVTINPPDAKYYVSYITIGPETRSLEEIRSVYKNPENYDGDPYKEKKILFAGRKSYRFFNKKNSNTEHIIVFYNDKIYSISTQKSENPKVIQSLASFKFIQ